MNPNIHLVISHFNETTWIKLTTRVSRLYAIGVLSEALNLMLNTPKEFIDPEECQLQAFLTLNDSQQYEEDTS